jgi:hypothetical protein
MAEKNLESSLRKIEAYIVTSEKTRDQEWRAAVSKKLDDLKYHLAQQDEGKKKERKMSNGRMFIAAGLPVLVVGLGMLLYGAINIDSYFDNYHVFSTPEIYMFIVGVVMVVFGFNWAREKED